MLFARRVFLIAGLFGLLVLPPQYFLEKQKVGEDFPPPITHPEHYYGFIGVALSFQVLFLIVARDPARYRPVMIPCVLEKATFGIAVIVLFGQQRLPAVVLGFGIVDLIFGLLFRRGVRPHPTRRVCLTIGSQAGVDAQRLEGPGPGGRGATGAPPVRCGSAPREYGHRRTPTNPAPDRARAASAPPPPEPARQRHSRTVRSREPVANRSRPTNVTASTRS